MSIEVVCQHCGARWNVSDEYAGAEAPCGKCFRTVTVPRPVGSEPSSDWLDGIENDPPAPAPPPARSPVAAAHKPTTPPATPRAASDQISFYCQSCGTRLHAPRAAAGRAARCKRCGQSLQVPTSAPRPNAPAAATSPAAAPAASTPLPAPVASSPLSALRNPLKDSTSRPHAAPSPAPASGSPRAATAAAPSALESLLAEEFASPASQHSPVVESSSYTLAAPAARQPAVSAPVASPERSRSASGRRLKKVNDRFALARLVPWLFAVTGCLMLTQAPFGVQLVVIVLAAVCCLVSHIGIVARLLQAEEGVWGTAMLSIIVLNMLLRGLDKAGVVAGAGFLVFSLLLGLCGPAIAFLRRRVLGRWFYAYVGSWGLTLLLMTSTVWRNAAMLEDSDPRGRGSNDRAQSVAWNPASPTIDPQPASSAPYPPSFPTRPVQAASPSRMDDTSWRNPQANLAAGSDIVPATAEGSSTVVSGAPATRFKLTVACFGPATSSIPPVINPRGRIGMQGADIPFCIHYQAEGPLFGHQGVFVWVVHEPRGGEVWTEMSDVHRRGALLGTFAHLPADLKECDTWIEWVPTGATRRQSGGQIQASNVMPCRRVGTLPSPITLTADEQASELAEAQAAAQSLRDVSAARRVVAARAPLGGTTVAAAISDLKSDDLVRQVQAIAQLQAMPPTENRRDVASLVEPLLTWSDRKARHAVIEVLSRWGTSETVAALQAVRARADFALQHQLDDAISKLSLRAQADAATEGAPLPQTIERLRNLDPHDFLDRRSAIKDLNREATPEMLPQLLAELQLAEFHEKAALVKVIGGLKDPRAAEALAACLTDFHCAQEAAQALVAIGPPAEEAVLSVLQAQNRSFAERETLDVLGQIATKKSVPTIKRLLLTRDAFFEKRQLIDLLVKIGGTEAAEVIVTCLGDESFFTIKDAHQALQALGTEAEPALIQGLIQPYPAVRYLCCDLLAQNGTPAAIPGLKKLRRDPVMEVRKAASLAIGFIEARAGGRNDEPEQVEEDDTPRSSPPARRGVFQRST